jgi:hypothetical protein
VPGIRKRLTVTYTPEPWAKFTTALVPLSQTG